MSAPDSKQAPHGANTVGVAGLYWTTYIYIYIYLCMYAYIYAHTEKEGS